ncbi:MAG: VWA domain-containing protein [Pyrinomonadaceae bacterium]
MKKFTKHGLLFFAFFVAFACAMLPPTGNAQSVTEKTARQKAFGSSLKRNNADAAKQNGGAANETSDEKPDENGARSGDAIRVETLLAVSDISVTDAGGRRFITGLGKDGFVVAEDGHPQQISTLADDTACLPRSIVLILDRSQSQLPYLDASIEAAKKLVNQLTLTDEMAIVTDDVQLVVDFTKNKKQLKEALDSLKKLSINGFHSRSLQWRCCINLYIAVSGLKFDGSSTIYGHKTLFMQQSRLQFSALLATLRELTGKKELPVIIFQTDGDEVERLGGNAFIQRAQPQQKSYSMADVYAAAEKSRVKIYTVIPSDKLIGLSPEETAERVRLMNEKSRRAQEKYPDMWEGHRRLPPPADTNATSKQNDAVTSARLAMMKQTMMMHFADFWVKGQEAAAHVADLTGGFTSFLEKPEQAKDIYARILADIDHRYIIGYYPTNKARDGRLRKVHIEIRNHPEYIVHGRESYYVETP